MPLRVNSFMGMSLKTGTIFICLLYMYGSFIIVGVLAFFQGIFYNLKSFDEVTTGFMWAIIVEKILIIVACTFLLFGTFNKKRGYFLPWLFINGLSVFLMGMSALLSLAAIFVLKPVMVLSSIIQLLVFLFLLYSQTVVLSYLDTTTATAAYQKFSNPVDHAPVVVDTSIGDSLLPSIPPV